MISDGFKTFEKVPTAYLVAHWCSVLLGLGGLVWLLLVGMISVVRYRTNVLQRTEMPAFIAIMLLLVPLPFFMTQSFMAIGDFTLAGVLLAAVTLLLPIGMVLTVTRASKNWKESHVNLIHGFGAAFVLQWCSVLFVAGMLPVRLWV